MELSILDSVWIREATGKTFAWIIPVGIVHGRQLYAVTWEDGSEEDYFIDFAHSEIELY